jgi:Peptidase inhibitor family I36
MTIDTTLWRRAAACLVAGIGVVLALTLAAGAAQATPPPDREMRSALDREMRSVLEHGAPGGKQISRNQIRWRKAGVTLTLSVPGEARAARFADCPRGYACLWQDSGGTNRRVQFYHYRTYRLAAYGMPPGRRRGASSYYNNQTGGAGAYLRGRPGTYWMFGAENLPRSWNDRARTITLIR